MKASIRTKLFGDSMTFSSDFPEPTFLPKTHNKKDVLVKLTAAGINPIDYKLPKAAGGPIFGRDFSGTITDVGSEVGGFAVGDGIFGNTSHGTICEITIASAGAIAKKPTEWNAVECAALPVAYMSALQGLRAGGVVSPDDGKNQEKESVLVIGASDGCGIAVLQLCKAMDVPRVVGICSGKNADFVKDAGATEVVDYTDGEKLNTFFEENKGKMDCVFDAATGSGGGENYWEKSIPLLKEKSGHYVALNGPAGKWMRKFVGIQKERQTIILSQFTTEDLETVTRLLDKISVKPIVTTMSFTDEGVRNAFDMLKSRRTKGKIVIEI